MKQIIVLAAIILALANTVSAYPIPQRPLRQLVIESEYIIVGYVVKTYGKENNIKTKDGKTIKISFGPRIAQIAVLENLQGQIKRDTIEIEFNTAMICPEPDRYSDNTYVISFIDKDKNGKFTTHALSYGAKTLNQEEIKIYKNRIAEIQKILKIKDENIQFDKTVEWLLTCAENPVTRWEGVAELCMHSAFWRNNFCDKNAFFKQGVTEETCRNFLSEDQKNRYKKVVFTTNELPDLNAVDLVYKNNEAEVTDFLLGKLKNIKEDHYWMANEFMRRLSYKNSSTEISGLLKNFSEIQFDTNKRKELKVIIDKFILLVETPVANRG